MILEKPGGLGLDNRGIWGGLDMAHQGVARVQGLENAGDIAELEAAGEMRDSEAACSQRGVE